jgi:nicotinate-nucleotide adenylyltransferase
MKIANFGGSFNPPCNHHLQIVTRLLHRFDKIIVSPCGLRQDKPSANVVSEEDRKAMAELAFGGVPKVELDCFDLENKVYTPTYLLQERYEKMFPGAQIWHIVGGDIIVGGRSNDSEIHRVWNRGAQIWQNLNFTVVIRPDYRIGPEDLPPHSELVEIKQIYGSGTMVRQRIAQGESIDGLVPQPVAKYIKEHRLYLDDKQTALS